MAEENRKSLGKLNLKNPWHLMAAGFGSGLLPAAPGTFGSIAAVPFCIALMYAPVYLQILIVIAVFAAGIAACQKAENALGVHDHGCIVIDEFVGMFVAVIAYPQNWYLVFLALVLFRIFDITKPLLIGYVDKKLKGGLGIMVDDVLAGLCALACGHLIILGSERFLS